MGRPLKYLEGEPIETIEDFAAEIQAGRYLIVRTTQQRVHPSWAASWQFRMALKAVQSRSLARTRPNPEHPENKVKT